MGNMHPLTKWVIDRIEKDYKDDIALLLDSFDRNNLSLLADRSKHCRTCR